jgi:hypothetical protein
VIAPEDRGDSVSDEPFDSAQSHQLTSLSSGDPAPAACVAEPDEHAVRAAVLGPTSLMPAVELPDAQPASPSGKLLWLVLVVLVAAVITAVVIATA